MADNNHKLVFSDAEYEKAAKQWGKEFLLMPLYSCMETLQYMTGMPGTRYKVALPTVEGNAQFAPYRSDRKSNDQTKVDFREIETFFGNVRIDFEPNKQIQMLIGQSAAFLGDGQAQAPSAKTVIASVMKSLGSHLNDALFTAVRNPNGDTTADLFNGWGTIIDSEIDEGGISAAKGNLLTLGEAITSANAVDIAKEIERSCDPHLRRLDASLNKMRSVAVYYREYSSIENLQLLGENYIKQMKRDLTPLTFQTSILCQRIGIAKDGFYSSMKEYHKYDASNMEFLDEKFREAYIYDKTQIDSNRQSNSNLNRASRSSAYSESIGVYSDVYNSVYDCRSDNDLDLDAPIAIGMDYNANINWIVAGQPKGRRLNVIKSFYVKFERKIPALVDDFCRYYAEHRNKTLVFYYDATALGSNYAVNEQDFRWVIIHEFERHGWTVEDVYLGNPMRHDESSTKSLCSFENIQSQRTTFSSTRASQGHRRSRFAPKKQTIAKNQRLMPFFNRQNNDDLILAIQAAGVTRGRNGFRKDKGGEKLAESEEDLLEHRTDGTDAFDTLYIGCEKFPFRETFSSNYVGIM